MWYNNECCRPTAHRGIAQLVEYRSPKPWVAGSNPPAPAIIGERFRYARKNKRKTEISRDFSVFFDSKFFRIFGDTICPFKSTEMTRTTEKAFFDKILIKIITLSSALGQKPLAFIKNLILIANNIDTTAFHKDMNLRKRFFDYIQNKYFPTLKGFEPTNT